MLVVVAERGLTHLSSTCSLPHYPEEDAKLRATSFRVRRGGNGGNSLEVLQQFLPTPADLGLHLVATLPNRHASATEKVVSSFGPDSPIDLSHCIYRDDQTEAASCWIMSSQATGTRTIVNHNALDDMTIDEFVAVADAFHNEGAEDMWWHFEVCPRRVPRPESRIRSRRQDLLISCASAAEKPWLKTRAAGSHPRNEPSMHPTPAPLLSRVSHQRRGREAREGGLAGAGRRG